MADLRKHPRVPDAVQRSSRCTASGTVTNAAFATTPDQQRTTPQARSAAQHPGNARWRKITIQDLMRHTSGIVYGGRGTTLVQKMYPDGRGEASRDYDGAAFMDRLAALPLLYQPGTVWDYGFGLDVLGLTIEKISGQSLGQYLQANLWRPLGMTDTGFSISPDKAARHAKPLPVDPDTGMPQSRTPELTQPLKFDCGGGCAVSTASDYLRFATRPDPLALPAEDQRAGVSGDHGMARR